MADMTQSSAKAGTGLESSLRAAAFSMKVKGQKQGDIKGDAPASWKGHDGEIQLFGWNQEVVSPRDPASGLPTGRRMHQPVSVWGKLSKASPMLFTSITTNENLPEVTINCYTQKAGSSMTVFFTVKLIDANVSTMEHFSSAIDGTMMYRLSFTFKTIEYTWMEGQLSGADDWEGRV